MTFNPANQLSEVTSAVFESTQNSNLCYCEEMGQFAAGLRTLIHALARKGVVEDHGLKITMVIEADDILEIATELENYSA